MAKKSIGYKLTNEVIEAITHVAIDKYKKAEQDAVKVRYDRRRSNTKLLLRNYRSLMDHCESAIYDAAAVDEGDGYTLADILELMSGNDSESLKIESIRQSAVRTRIIVDHIDAMLDLYRHACDRSTKEEDKRRYRVIYWLYLDEEPKTAVELAEEEYVDKRTIHRDVDSAIERLTALIFGIDGLNLIRK